MAALEGGGGSLERPPQERQPSLIHSRIWLQAGDHIVGQQVHIWAGPIIFWNIRFQTQGIATTFIDPDKEGAWRLRYRRIPASFVESIGNPGA